MPALGVTGLYSSVEVQARIRELIKLAKEQGYLTFDDLNEALPEGVTDADELDLILTRLRRLEIDIIEASEVDRYRDGKKDVDEEEEEEEGRATPKVDILDDPVRMYLKQMGQVPLLTRDQEVQISKRIEEAEAMVQKHLSRFGFVARGHLELAQKLIEGRERFDRVILDKKIESRERYMKNLPRLCKQVEQLSVSINRHFSELVRDLFKKGVAKAQGTAKNDGDPAKDLPSFLPEAAGDRGIRAPRRRGASHVAISPDRARQKSSQQKTAVAASEQGPRFGNKPVVFAFRLFRGISDAEKLAAPGIQGQNRNGRGQSSSRYFHREEIYQSRFVVSRPDPGRKHGTDEGSREV